MFDRLMQRATLSVAGLLVCAVAWSASAAELEETLNKSITVEFLDTPLGSALDRLQRDTGVNFVIDPNHAGQIEKNTVSLRLTGTSVRDALDLMCLMTEADWDITNGVVFVSTAMEMTRRRIETRVYDIRGMLVAVQNQVAPTLDLVEALSNTNSGGGGGRQSKSGGGGGGSIFGDEASVENMMTRSEMVESIISLIEDGMGELAEINGGDFKVSEINGTLVIRATPESHEQAAELLGSLEQQAGKMVQVQSEFFVLPRTVLDGLIKENGGSLVVGPDRLAELHSAIAETASSRLAATRNVGFNGQRVFVYAGRDRQFISDLEPVPEAQGLDTTLSVLRDGVVLDVLPTLVRNGEEAVVAIKSDVIPALSDIKPAAGDEAGRLAVGPLQAPDRDTLFYRTTVRIPVGGAVILAGSSDLLDSVNADDSEIVMLLRVDAVE